MDPTIVVALIQACVEVLKELIQYEGAVFNAADAATRTANADAQLKFSTNALNTLNSWGDAINSLAGKVK